MDVDGIGMKVVERRTTGRNETGELDFIVSLKLPVHRPGRAPVYPRNWWVRPSIHIAARVKVTVIRSIDGLCFTAVRERSVLVAKSQVNRRYDRQASRYDAK